MLIDHAAAAMLPSESPAYLLCRTVGRIAFPLFCFMLVEGFYYTRSRIKYAGRLLITALVSEVPFDMVMTAKLFDWNYQNTVWTLLIGYLAIWLLETTKKAYYPVHNFVYISFSCLIIWGAAIGAALLGTDYGMFGVLVILLIYFFRGYNRWFVIGGFIICCVAMSSLVGNLELFGALGLCLLFFYKGKKGPDDHKLFYLFYPLHLLIIGILVMYVFV